MAQERQTQSNGTDVLEEIARSVAQALVEADGDVEVLYVQFVTDGTYLVSMTERGCEPNEPFQVSQA